ncbi:mucin-4-like [Cyrtonyx montezumae]|uniref:mucin-4-like n=1 Tax=Cyrtonyx montezumae TaxID=9017 RepID=UPI0032DB1A0C
MGARGWMLPTFMGCCLWILQGLGTAAAVPVTTEGPFAATPLQSEAPTALLLGTVSTSTVNDNVMAESIHMDPTTSPSFPSKAEPDSVTTTTAYNSPLGTDSNAGPSAGEMTQAPTGVPQAGMDMATSLDATPEYQSGLASTTAAAIVVTPQPNFTPSATHNVTGTTTAAPLGSTPAFADVPASASRGRAGLESTTDPIFLLSATIPTTAGTQPMTTTPLHPRVTVLPPTTGAEEEGVALPGNSQGDGRAPTSIPSPGAEGLLPTPWGEVPSGTVGDTPGWAALESGGVGDAANGDFGRAELSHLPPENVTALETAENPGQSSLLTDQTEPSPANLLGPGDGDRQEASAVLPSSSGSALADSEATAAPGVRGNTASLLPATDVQSNTDVPAPDTGVALPTGAVGPAVSSLQPAPWLSPTGEKQSLLGAALPALTDASGAPSTAFPAPGVAAGSLPASDDGAEAVVSPDFSAALGVSLPPSLEGSQPWETAADGPSTGLNSALGATNPSPSASDGAAWLAEGVQAQGDAGAEDTAKAENAEDGSPSTGSQSDTSNASSSTQQDPSDIARGAALHPELFPAPAPGNGALAPALSPDGPAAPGHDLSGAGGAGPIEALGSPSAALPPPSAVDGTVFEANNGAETAVSPDLGAAPEEPASPTLLSSQPWDTAAGAPEDTALPGAEGSGSDINSVLDAPSSALYEPTGPPSPFFGVQPVAGLGIPEADGPNTSLSSALGAANPSSTPDIHALPAAGEQVQSDAGTEDTTQSEDAGNGSPSTGSTSFASSSTQQGPADIAPGVVLHPELFPAPVPGNGALAPALSTDGPAAPGHDLSGAGGAGPIEALGSPSAALPPPSAVDGTVFEANNGAETAVSPDLGAIPEEPASPSLVSSQPWDTAAGAPEDTALSGAEGSGSDINSVLDAPTSSSYGLLVPPSPDIVVQPDRGLTVLGEEEQAPGGVSSTAILEPSLSSSPGTGLAPGTGLLSSAGSASNSASPIDVLAIPSVSESDGAVAPIPEAAPGSAIPSQDSLYGKVGPELSAAQGTNSAGGVAQAGIPESQNPYTDTSPEASSTQQDPSDIARGAALHPELFPAPAPGNGALAPALSTDGPAAPGHDLSGAGGAGPIEALGSPSAALPPPSAVDGTVFEANNGAETAVNSDLGAIPEEPASPSLGSSQPWDTAAGAPEDTALSGAEGSGSDINSVLDAPSSALYEPTGPPSPFFGVQPVAGLGIPEADGPNTSLSSALGATNPSSTPDIHALPAAGEQVQSDAGTEDTTQSEDAGDGSPSTASTSLGSSSTQQGPADTAPGAVLHPELFSAPAPGNGALAPALSTDGPAAPGHDLSGAGGAGPIEALGSPSAALPPPSAVDGTVFEANNGAETAVNPDLGAIPEKPASPSLVSSQPWDTAAGAPEDTALPGAEGSGSDINSVLDAPSSALYEPTGPPSPDTGVRPGTGLTVLGEEGQALGGVSSTAALEPSLSFSPGTGAGSPSGPASPSDVLTAPSASDTTGPGGLGGAGNAHDALQPSLGAAPELHPAAGGVSDRAEAVSADGETPGETHDQTGTGATAASDGKPGVVLHSTSSFPSADGSSSPGAVAGADAGADFPGAGGAGSNPGLGAAAFQGNKETPILAPTIQSSANIGLSGAKLSQANVLEPAGGELGASAQGEPSASGGKGVGTVIEITSGGLHPSIPISSQETHPLVPVAPDASSPLVVDSAASARGVGDSSVPKGGFSSASSIQSGSSSPVLPWSHVAEMASGMPTPLGEELQRDPNAAPALPSASERENLKEGAAPSPQLSSPVPARQPAAAPTLPPLPTVPAVPLYGYGARENDREYVQRRVDFSSPLFKPETGFPFGKTLRDSLYFTDNGQIIFPASSSSILTLPNPPAHGFTGREDVPMIAVFWDNADFSRGTGTTFYQEFLTLNSQKPPFVRDVEAKVRRYMRSSYSAAWTLKITWEKAPAYGARGNSRRTNTYQAVLTTDGFRSYVLILYQDGGMQWDYTQLAATNVLIGYTSGDGYYRNDDLSQGSPAAKYRPDRYRGYNTDLRGLWLYKLESRVGNNYRLKCLAWTGQQQEPRAWSQDLPACPCSLKQGQQDPRFRSGRGGK